MSEITLAFALAFIIMIIVWALPNTKDETS